MRTWRAVISLDFRTTTLENDWWEMNRDCCESSKRNKNSVIGGSGASTGCDIWRPGDKPCLCCLLGVSLWASSSAQKSARHIVDASGKEARVGNAPLEDREQRPHFAKIDCNRSSLNVAGQWNKPRQDKVWPLQFQEMLPVSNKCYRTAADHQDRVPYRNWPCPAMPLHC